MFASALNMNRVLSDQSSRVVEVPCSGASDRSMVDALHHLTGCQFKKDFSNNSFTYRLKVGEFEWRPVACGPVGQKMKKGEMAAGALVSFLGNASGGVLKPWVSENARVCNFVEGVSPAPLMIQKAKNDHAIGTMIAMIVCYMIITYASSCVFFPDKSLDASDAALNRSFSIGLMAMVASCFVSALGYYSGDVGTFIGVLVVTLVLFVRYDPAWFQRRQVEDEDPSEQEPLLPNSSAHPPQPAEEPAPEPPRPQPPQPTVEQDASRPKLGGSTDLATAICLGVAGGLLLGGILTGLMVLLTQRD